MSEEEPEAPAPALKLLGGDQTDVSLLDGF